MSMRIERGESILDFQLLKIFQRELLLNPIWKWVGHVTSLEVDVNKNNLGITTLTGEKM